MNRRLGIDSMGTDGGQDEKGSRGYVPLLPGSNAGREVGMNIYFPSYYGYDRLIG